MNTGLMPRSRDAWAHWIIIRITAQSYSAYSMPENGATYSRPRNGSSTNALMTNGNSTRNADDTLSCSERFCQVSMKASAATSMLAMDRMFTVAPTAGVSTAIARTTPHERANAPMQNALRQ